MTRLEMRTQTAPTATADPNTPVSLTFLGNLYGDAKVLTLARAYQDATTFHLRHPNLDA